MEHPSNLSDNGPEFVSHIVKEVCRFMHTEKQTTTPYHPQCNGLTERQNSTIASVIRMYCSEHTKDWGLFVPMALWSYRNSEQKTLGASPYRLLFGRDPAMTLDTLMRVPARQVEADDFLNELFTNIRLGQEFAHQRLQDIADSYKEQGEALTNPLQFQPGALVLMHWVVHKQGVATKFAARRWHGPYRVVRRHKNGVSYDIQAGVVRPGMPREEYHRVHATRLKPCHARDADRFPLRDGAAYMERPTVTDPEHAHHNHLMDVIWRKHHDPDEVIPDRIVDERTLVTGTKYLMKYHGYTVNSAVDWWPALEFRQEKFARLLRRWEKEKSDEADDLTLPLPPSAKSLSG